MKVHYQCYSWGGVNEITCDSSKTENIWVLFTKQHRQLCSRKVWIRKEKFIHAFSRPPGFLKVKSPHERRITSSSDPEILMKSTWEVVKRRPWHGDRSVWVMRQDNTPLHRINPDPINQPTVSTSFAKRVLMLQFPGKLNTTVLKNISSFRTRGNTLDVITGGLLDVWSSQDSLRSKSGILMNS